MRVTDVLENGTESVASDAVPIDLGADDILRIVFADPSNRFANPNFVERTPDGLPLDFQVVVTGCFARTEGEDFVLGTNGAQTGTTPSFATDSIAVDPTDSTPIESEFTLAEPESGTLAGRIEVIVREYNAAGLTSDTVLFTATAPGDYEIEQTMAAYGTIGALLAWKADTVRAELIERFAGASKNLAVHARWVGLREHNHKPRRAHRGGPERLATAPPNVPQTSVADPPEPPSSPEAYPVPYPDRPLSSGVVLEDIDFETAGVIPSGWTSQVDGTTLSVESGYLRSRKGVA